MQIELEKKYNLSEKDHAIIKDKCKFLGEKNIKDYYLDKNLILAKKRCYLRLRDGQYELKVIAKKCENEIVSAEEYSNEEEIEKKIAEYGVTTDDVTGIMFIDTMREKYEYTYNGVNINIDIDRFQYGERYEIEILYSDEHGILSREGIEDESNRIMESFRAEIGLTGQSGESAYKTVICAMHQNIDLYEIMMSQ